ncbi:MAG TPA: hypothetical protein VE172_20465 [Stackebrandtia sp.]|jgi:hypothetical protein|uniref:hypothetical protein n=1 Tax=Stackebrandtia sp. TaxID=2023065 RepID=UPI002D6D0592|nr:hypothetical protein [Stackebrandtia sp.]HZE41180.1 hypothetical protein [Stackebrandtia sp.]
MPRKVPAGWMVVNQRPPKRALMRLVGYLVAGGVITAFTWLIFASEPAALDTGATNPAAKAPVFVGIVVVLGILVVAIPALRPPRLAANHYGIAVRPGAFRTVLLPWAHVEEVTAMTVPGRRTGDAYMLIAVDDYCGHTTGDRPRFLDRAVLREANRATEGRVDNFDLAVRLADFVGEPDIILDKFAKLAPAHVDVTNQLDESEEAANA